MRLSSYVETISYKCFSDFKLKDIEDFSNMENDNFLI